MNKSKRQDGHINIADTNNNFFSEDKLQFLTIWKTVIMKTPSISYQTWTTT